MIVTHDHDVAARCKRIINLKDGQVIGDRVNA
jgi:predicted ABC-type transport system involved in lysophospholipase L1 biosynthesis ATPase subunit